MGYSQVWKTLDELIMELRKRGEPIPTNVMEDLRAGKTMIQILKADPTRTENIPSIEMYLNNVESYLIFTAQQKFGAPFAEEWVEKLRQATKTVRVGKAEKEAWEPASKFVPGLPRGKKWIRVQVSAENPKTEIKRLATECGLSTRIQPDGYMLVYGEDERLKLFVQKTGEKLRSRKSW